MRKDLLFLSLIIGITRFLNASVCAASCEPVIGLSDTIVGNQTNHYVVVADDAAASTAVDAFIAANGSSERKVINSVYQNYVLAPDGWSAGTCSLGWLGYGSTSASDGMNYGTYFIYIPGYAPDNCRNERAELISNCGSADNYDINEETCVGQCKCPPESIPDCSDHGGLLLFDYDRCVGACNDCSDEYQQAVSDCWFTGLAWFDQDSCAYKCDTCDARYALCMSECEGDIQYYDCVPEEGGSGKVVHSQCLCVTETDPPPLPKEPEPAPEPDPEPNPDPTPEPDPEPDPEDEHPELPWLKSIKGDTGKLVDLGNKADKKLANIGENIRRGVENQGILDKSLRAIKGSLDKGLGKLEAAVTNSGNEGTDTSGIESRLDGIGEKLEELKPGDDFGEITTSDFEKAYSLDEEFDVSDRFGTFVDTIKTTGLFSVPDQFFGSLPSGGSSLIHIDAGQYGDHNLDLNDTFGPGLVVLRSLFVIIFGFLSIRAVVMKR